MKEKDGRLGQLKKEYAVIQKKYKLPPFSDLNDDFDVEKLQEKETEHLLRLVRFVMVEKIANVVRFLELLLNPSEGATPLFILATLKSINPETRKEIEDLYKNLSRIELASLSLDIYHKENEEAKFISEVYSNWVKSKVKLKAITQKLGMTWGSEDQGRGYLG